MKKPLVSIITPLYNSEDYIGRTIEAVQNQTYSNWEMLIVDDCSTDAGVEVMKQYAAKDSRIQILSNETNSGAAVSRNKGIEAAKGKFISFLDSDDQWLPNKLEEQVGFMQENKSSFTFTYYNQIDEEGKVLGVIDNLPSKVDYHSTMKNNKIGCLTAMYDAESLGKTYMANIRKRQDYTLWLKLLKKTDYAYCVPKVLATYTIRKDSISSNRSSLIKYHWHIYRHIESQSFLKSLYYLIYWMVSKVIGGSSR